VSSSKDGIRIEDLTLAQYVDSTGFGSATPGGSVAPVRIGICEFTTLGASFEEDLVAYRAAGVKGIGVCELKLGNGSTQRLRESGLRATHCVPAVPSILPLPPIVGPAEPEERLEALCAGVRRLAELDPECVLFLTGPADGRDDAREVVREGIRAVAAAGAAAGVRVALEPVHPTQHEVFSFVHTIPDALELIGGAEVGIMVDTFHISDPVAVAPYVERIVGVHLADRREPTRSAFDRVLPGDGVLALGPVLRALQEGGYDGWYDVEIFSDNGAFGESFPDSLWDLDPADLACRARESAERVLESVGEPRVPSFGTRDEPLLRSGECAVSPSRAEGRSSVPTEDGPAGHASGR
jgi:sugar phosphate isomerase/epimerase